MNSPDRSYQLRPLTMDDFQQVTNLWRSTDGMSQLESAEELGRFLTRNPDCSILAEAVSYTHLTLPPSYSV